jgi:hypothetical protein
MDVIFKEIHNAEYVQSLLRLQSKKVQK